MEHLRCPKCGMETDKPVCPLCGEEIIHKTHSKSSLIGKFLPLPTKIIIALWILDSFYMLLSENHTFGQWIIVMIFGTLIYGAITNAIYYFWWKPRKTKNKQHSRIYENKTFYSETNYAKEYHQKSFDAMEGHEFEYFCADILEKNGYENVEVTKGSGDQGIDIVAYKEGIKYGIQCKCYSSDIGNKAVQEAFAGKTFYGCHVAVVLTNRYFTKSAKELAEKNGVLLWDRDKLKAMASNAGVKQTSAADNKDNHTININEARKVMRPYIYNEYLKVLYRQYPNDRIRAIKNFSISQNLSLRESKKIVDRYYDSMK